MKNMFTPRVMMFLSSATFLLIFGCASSPGVNQNQFFSKGELNILPEKAILDEESEKLETGSKFGEGAVVQAFFTSGIAGAGLAGSPTFTEGIRGNFAAGKAFEETLEELSGGKEGKLFFKITNFQQFLAQGAAPRLQAIMSFETADKNGNSALSAYACSWESRGPILSPGDEKDMLREMVEHSLNHWAHLFNREKENFPQTQKGILNGSGVVCSYEVFVKK